MNTEKANTPSIPEELRAIYEMKRWALFRNANDKVPVNPFRASIGQYASPSDRTTWSDGDTAERQARKYGYQAFQVMPGEVKPGIFLCAFDIDHCITGGQITPEARELIDEMNSYTETSASGTGVHILFFAKVDPRMKAITNRIDVMGAGTKLEFFSRDHFIGVMGNQYGNSKTIALRTEQLKNVYERYFEYEEETQKNPYEPQKAPQSEGNGYTWANNLTDEEILTRALKHPGFKFLWEGSITEYGEDHSTADMALVGKLAFWTNGDPQRIDRLFRQSGLMRSKWDERHGKGTYGQMTIKKALQGFTPSIPKTVQPEQDPENIPVYIERDPIQEPEQKTMRIISAGQYMEAEFYEDTQKNKAGMNRKTDIEAIDREIQSVWAGMYTIIASPGTGKSALMFQIAGNLAGHEEPVLYFSLEMTPHELMSRAIANEHARTVTPQQAVNAGEVANMSGTIAEKVEEIIKSAPMQRKLKNLYIIPAQFDMNIETIISTAEQFIQEHGSIPVVVIDYLQIIPPQNLRMNEREAIDYNVRRLKQFQMKHNAVVFVISSTARTNYYGAGGMDGAKGSGTIEFTANYVWTLQYKELEEIDLKKPQAVKQKVREELEKTPRKLALSCSKSRNGRSGWTVSLDFYPAQAYFMGSRN